MAARFTKLRLLQNHVRRLNLHEYQSQDLLGRHGVSIARGGVAFSEAEAVKVARSLPQGAEFVIKAQVLAGGRGMGKFTSGLTGGVQLCKTEDDVKQFASQMLGNSLVTKQTGKDGLPVSKVFVVERLPIKSEFYFAILMDRQFQGPVIVASSKGGMDIEHVAATTPDAIIKEPVDILRGLLPGQAARIVQTVGFSNAVAPAAVAQVEKMYDLFMKTDSTMLEINPWVETKDGRAVALDAKINFDDNAEFRQKEIFAMRDLSQIDKKEIAAQNAGLNYIALNGNIGCLVNGAGLAMATMDIIALCGGSPANFLDVGGGANEQQVTEAFAILSSDKQVKAIFVNIFGGIMRCDIIAQGIINAAKNLGLSLPLVVRLQGTNTVEGRKLLADSGLPMTVIDHMQEAAAAAVKHATASA